MALRKNGNSKSSASYMPYDSSNSFVRKMTNKVTGLIGWRSQSQSSVISQNYDTSSSSIDEDTVLPSPKRIRVQNVDEEDTLLRLIPSTSKAMNEVFSPIQPINDITTKSANSRNKCFVSSTPANIFSTTSVQTNPKHQTYISNVTDSFDNNESVNTSLTIPQFNVHQNHNVTVPAICKDLSTRVQNVDTSIRAGSFSTTNSHRPSFNMDVFSNSSRRLSMSVCENRNVGSLSPFYSARTMYGGASALLPYGNPSMSKMRSASMSRLNLFSPRSQITIQPVSPSPSKSNDQETMSTTARRILDTLERYCSPVMDAKRIPVNDLRRTTTSETSLQLTPSKGVKRKLPSLNQMTPSTTDLLRIKRQEKLQDSVSSARQVVGTVLDSTIAAEDSDSSSDSVDLDYNVLKTDTNTTDSQKYVGKIRRKHENKLDNDVLPTLKLPNAVLKITNLPKFDIADTFTFSKPLLLENLEQGVTRESGRESLAISTTTGKGRSCFQITGEGRSNISNSDESTPTGFAQVMKPSSQSPENVITTGSQLVVKPPLSGSQNSLVFSKSPRTTTPWTCKVCLLESTDERCSSCTSRRDENKKPVELRKPPISSCETFPKSNTDVPPPLSHPSSNDLWKSLGKAASDTWKCDACWVQNKLSETKCVSCGTTKEPITTTDSIETTIESVKSKFSFGVNEADNASVTIQSKLDTKLSANASCGIVGISSTSAPASTTNQTYTFGFGSTSAMSSAVSSSSDTKVTTISAPTPTFSFGDSSVKIVPTTTTTSQFSFGLKETWDSAELTTCNTIIPKSPVTDGSNIEKSIDTKKNLSIFNDVSSITNNTENPLLKSTTVAETDTGVFKSSKSVSLFEKASANKENGDDKSVAAGNSIFHSISSSGTEQSLKKKNVLFPSFGSMGSAAQNTFGSNGFAKPEPNSSLTNTNTSAIVSSSVFGSGFSSPTSSKLTNDIQNVPTPSFGIASSKVETMNANEDGKSSKLFFNANSFGVTSSTQQPSQLPITNSMFGGFGSGKLEAQATTSSTTFNTAPVFNFGGGNESSGTVNQPTSSGGFSFNGPKANDAASKFAFGSTAITEFNFRNAVTNEPSKQPVNSIFAGANSVKGNQSELQTNSNSVLSFGNSMFGGASQPPQHSSQTMNATKKPGGFSFPSPSQFGTQSVNNFSGFGNTSVENQDQNRLNNNAAPSTSPYVFGSANLTVPQTFNFTGGNPLTSFSAQPTANNTASTGVAPRRIKKAVRRTAK